MREKLVILFIHQVSKLDNQVISVVMVMEVFQIKAPLMGHNVVTDSDILTYIQFNYHHFIYSFQLYSIDINNRI